MFSMQILLAYANSISFFADSALLCKFLFSIVELCCFHSFSRHDKKSRKGMAFLGKYFIIEISTLRARYCYDVKSPKGGHVETDIRLSF